MVGTTYCMWSQVRRTLWLWAAHSCTSGRSGSWATGRLLASAECFCCRQEDTAAQLAVTGPYRTFHCLAFPYDINNACWRHLKKPDPTKIPAMFSRATPVLTMLGSWTTPNSTTVSNSPGGEKIKGVYTNYYKGEKTRSNMLDCLSSPVICGTRTTALKHRKRKLSGCIPTVLRGKQAEESELFGPWHTTYTHLLQYLPVEKGRQDEDAQDAKGQNVEDIGQEHLPFTVQTILTLLIADGSQCWDCVTESTETQGEEGTTASWDVQWHWNECK